MLVRDFMSPNPITVRPESDYLAAIALMRAGRFRRLPVVDKDGNLVGIVTYGDLRRAQPNHPAPGAMVGDGIQVRVRELMSTDLITVEPDLPLEEAARLMVCYKIGGLPVVEKGKLLGIITETDIFHEFVDMLGGGTDSLRVVVQVDDRLDQIAGLATRIAEVGGNISSLAAYHPPEPGRLNLAIRVGEIWPKTLVAAVQRHAGAKILNMWWPPSREEP
jgi:acetoin utilization protein AcuB